MEIEIKNKEIGVKVYAPKLTIYRDDYLKLVAYALEAKGEISGFMEVKEHQDGCGYHLHSPIIFEQECTSVTTELDSTSVAKFFDQIVRVKGGDPTVFRCWWHSHVDMDVFYSGTDNNSIDEFTEDWGFAIGITVNRRGEIYTRMQFKSHAWVEIEHIPLTVVDTLPDAVLDSIKADVGNMVRERVYISPTSDKVPERSIGYRPNYTLQEPYRSGVLRNSIWRNEENGKVWSYDFKEWMYESGKSTVSCDGCDENFVSLEHNHTLDGFFCTTCEDLFEKMDLENMGSPYSDLETFRRYRRKTQDDITAIG